MESMHVFVVQQLQARGRKEWDAVAARTKVSRRTIEKIASGEIVFPRVDKIEALAEDLGYEAHVRQTARVRKSKLS